MMTTSQELSQAIAQLMPRIIQGVQLEFLVKKTLTQTQFLVLVGIHSRGICAMNALAQSMHVSMPTMTGIIDRLVQKGYVTRSVSAEDRRKVLVELSAKGKNMITQFQAAVSHRWVEVLSTLNQEDIDLFAGIIAKLGHNLKGQK